MHAEFQGLLSPPMGLYRVQFEAKFGFWTGTMGQFEDMMDLNGVLFTE